MQRKYYIVFKSFVIQKIFFKKISFKKIDIYISYFDISQKCSTFKDTNVGRNALLFRLEL